MGPYPESTFLGSLDQADQDAVLRAGRTTRHQPGETVLREGGPSTSVVFVMAGTVKLVKSASSGRAVVLELRGPGEVMGDLGVIDGEPRSASAVALDRVELVVLPAAAFLELTRSRPGIAQAMIATLVRRLREASGRQLELGSTDVVGRVCARLAQLCTSHGQATDDGVLLDRAISQQELADWCGSSRDSIVRAL
ncbi:MAG: Crp/Fnr family transcriptional regulator, partial [Acidimicrobiia bacterium]|nr:Crp/Fnr family transcriptional regulator [Acidimicrobiia bacterium]